MKADGPSLQRRQWMGERQLDSGSAPSAARAAVSPPSFNPPLRELLMIADIDEGGVSGTKSHAQVNLDLAVTSLPAMVARETQPHVSPSKSVPILTEPHSATDNRPSSVLELLKKSDTQGYQSNDAAWENAALAVDCQTMVIPCGDLL